MDTLEETSEKEFLWVGGYMEEGVLCLERGWRRSKLIVTVFDDGFISGVGYGGRGNCFFRIGEKRRQARMGEKPFGMSEVPPGRIRRAFSCGTLPLDGKAGKIWQKTIFFRGNWKTLCSLLSSSEWVESVHDTGSFRRKNRSTFRSSIFRMGSGGGYTFGQLDICWEILSGFYWSRKGCRPPAQGEREKVGKGNLSGEIFARPGPH